MSIYNDDALIHVIKRRLEQVVEFTHWIGEEPLPREPDHGADEEGDERKHHDGVASPSLKVGQNFRALKADHQAKIGLRQCYIAPIGVLAIEALALELSTGSV